ncbi:hypothetical protein YDYSG_51550 [Paenibacillus tyrfis]|uniref:hypothetical protein n=1 Tax=Paenibacillus tyrfis TaxID=1501230 RepID=UPI00248F54E6|nr:hypothetical protein [Paenibacillus tyrfis]GLI09123.1 hypothetical protein YDYSG_51550 [Paenibacillus tyrfis]
METIGQRQTERRIELREPPENLSFFAGNPAFILIPEAHLTALGVLVALEHILGLDGKQTARGGVYLPETLVSIDAAIARFEQFGVQISSELNEN